jgi:DNA-binding Xre family transcriptional regulator
MLRLNIKRVCALRGVSNPYRSLVTLGISRPVATNLLNNVTNSIQGKHLEKICEFLNCTPDDLYQWTPSADTRNVDTHPLRGLRRDTKPARYNELIRNIPLDKIDEVEKMLSDLSGTAELPEDVA